MPDVDELFAQLRACPEAERATWLDQVSDEDLRRQLLELWHAWQQAQQEQFLAGATFDHLWTDSAATSSATEPSGVAASSSVNASSGARDSVTGPIPERVGRYRILTHLGQGGFGDVYRAVDETLGRDVAIKIPRRDLSAKQSDVKALLREAQLLARLDHPHLASVYDAGKLPDGRAYLVTKFVPGEDLAAYQRRLRPSVPLAVKLVCDVAGALSAAHEQGILHGDVKPANILVSREGDAYLTDFGLARHGHAGSEAGPVGGTPAYMSPEQVASESHRVDAQSDIFSLGVVLYELLSARHPFPGRNRHEILDRILHAEPRPLSESEIPAELGRCCCRALAKRKADRYTTAKEFAADLRQWLWEGQALRATADAETLEERGTSTPPRGQPLAFRGLHPYRGEDAVGYAELIPGPRTTQGSPKLLVDWRERLLDPQIAQRAPVLAISGPIGSGKTSLVLAGIVPSVGSDCDCLVVDLSLPNWEAELRRQLHAAHDENADRPTLDQCFRETRERLATSSLPRKTLVIVDQFEGWSELSDPAHQQSLIAALRHCDGVHLQAIVVARDDAWAQLTRLFQQLELPLREGENLFLVDWLEQAHARQVLTMLGRACGALPNQGVELTRGQRECIRLAVQAVSDQGRVAPLGLALWALAHQRVPWEPQSIRQSGKRWGVESYMQLLFASSPITSEEMTRDRTALDLLELLLPVGKSNAERPTSTLAQLAERLPSALPANLALALDYLCDDCQLVQRVPINASSGPAEPHYRLTQTSLTTPVRRWLARRQTATLAGRALQLLQDKCRVWGRKRDVRSLASLWALGQILCWTTWRRWTGPQRQFVRASVTYQALRLGLFSLVLLAGTWFAWQAWDQAQTRTAENWVERLLEASAANVPELMHQPLLVPQPALILLRDRYENTTDERTRLRCLYGLAARGEPNLAALVTAVKEAPDQECVNVQEALKFSAAEASERLAEAFDTTQDVRTKVRLAVALLNLGESRALEQCIRRDADPWLRSQLLEDAQILEPRPEAILKALAAPASEGTTAGLILLLAQVDKTTCTVDAQRQALVLFTRYYQSASQGDNHAAARFALQKWRLPLPELAVQSQPKAEQNYFVNGQGMLMLRIPPGEFDLGQVSGPTVGANELKRKFSPTLIQRPAFLSAHEVTIDLFRQLLNDPDYPTADKPNAPFAFDSVVLSSDQMPAVGVSWSDAVLFCNWLSVREGRTPCYRHAEKRFVPHTNRFWRNWTCDFSANGYRLPTEAEWEYCCRAGTTNRFSFGDDVRYLHLFGVYAAQTPQPVGSKFPNPWGFFDMHGNAYEWCWDWHAAYPTEIRTDPTGPEDGQAKVMRGGCWSFPDGNWAHSTRRNFHDMLDYRDRNIGFRVACAP